MCHNVTNALKDKIFLELRPEVNATVNQKQYATIWDPTMYPYTKFAILTSNNIGAKVTETPKQCATLWDLKMYPHTKYEIPTSNNRRYAPDKIFLELRSEVKVTVTQKQYVTLHNHEEVCARLDFSRTEARGQGQ